MRCIKVSDLMCGVGLRKSNKCDADVCKINDMLMTHYSLLMETNVTKVASWFVDPGTCTVTVNSINGEDIYKVHYIAVTHEEECNSCYKFHATCMLDKPSCECCKNWKLLPIREWHYSLDVGEYSIDCDKVTVNVWEQVKKWYVVYSKWPKLISGIDDDICIDPREYELLKAWLQRQEAERKWDYEAANYFENKQFRAKERLMKAEEVYPYIITYLNNDRGKNGNRNTLY